MEKEKEPNQAKSNIITSKLQSSSLLLNCTNERATNMFKHLLIHIQQYLNNSSEGKPTTQLQKPKEKPKVASHPNNQTKKSNQNQQKSQSSPKTPKKQPIRTSLITASPLPYQIQMPPVKRIKTPDWIENKEPISPQISQESSPLVPFEEFNFVKEHQMIELFEARIISGIEEDFYHPAQARDLAAESFDVVMTKEETEKSDRYQCTMLPEKTPLFWPERVWDTPESMMTEEESNSLKSEIETINILPKEFPKPPPPRSPTPSQHKRSHSSNTKRSRHNFVVQIQFGSIDTDDDDFTDFSDF
ncbi:hypothetical protein GPJ56_002329 [Histomonas meleagridis]|uniref:uncharacterized protein n=1 Tax=Histomonas meleagridis TaxID=135588 RepID=UPI003559D0D1|nr:hypothetical protein GPJ56_002329 [Histomonas meleagridis]KAH0804590.1 hypothetical protein GO595_003420 [Histomonas meleagridis]